jgi:outer membrane murein-binding lipoprotein Lpp
MLTEMAQSLQALGGVKTELISAVVGVVMGAGLVAVSGEQQVTERKLEQHIVDYTKLEAEVAAVAKDVSYNRERGDIIQEQNTSSHSRQEKQLNELDSKLDKILIELQRFPR